MNSSRNDTTAAAGDGQAAFLILLFFFFVYLLGYSGRFHSIDEVTMFAMAESTVKYGDFSMDQLRWSESNRSTSVGKYGLGEKLYSMFEPTDSVLVAPLLALAQRTHRVGNVEVALLLNPLVGALLASTFFLYVRRLGYAPPVALLMAAALGLGTLIWPYSKYFFREPLSALGLLATAYFALSWKVSGNSTYLPLAGLALGVALGTRSSNTPAVPGLALALLWYARQPGQRLWAITRSQLRVAALFSLGLLPAYLVLVVGYSYASFGVAVRTVYTLQEHFSGPFLVGLYGLLLSPGKGLFLYVPLLLASLVALPRFCRRHPVEGTLVLLVAVPYLGFFARYFQWWGGLAWGPRFLVSLLPLLLLPLAPLVEAALRPNRPWLRAALLALGILSASVQVLGLSVDYGAHLSELVDRYGTPVPETNVLLTSPALSPILGQLSHWQARFSDVAWVRQAADGSTRILWGPLAVLGASAALFGTLALRSVSRSGWAAGSEEPPHRPSQPLPSLTEAAQPQFPPGSRAARSADQAGVSWRALVLAGLALVGTGATAGYILLEVAAARPEGDLGAAARQVEQEARPGDALITLLTYRTETFLNLYKGDLPHYGLAPEPLAAGGRTETLLLRLASEPRRLWVVAAGVDRADPENGVERWLAENTYEVWNHWLGEARVALYAVPPAGEALAGAPGLEFGAKLRLEEYRLQPPRAAPGEEIYLLTRWRARATLDEGYDLFANLVDHREQGWAGSTSPPAGGYRPTRDWKAGEVVEDRRTITVPKEATSGLYRMEVGVFAPADGERLPAHNVAGEKASAFAVPVVVRPTHPVQVPPAARRSGAVLGGQAALAAYRLESTSWRRGGNLDLTLYWLAERPMDSDYTVFVHALDGEGRLAFQQDGPPGGGAYPTSVWEAGEIVEDRHAIPLAADLPVGRYRLVVGMYSPATLTRLPVAGQNIDSINLGEVEVRE